MDKYCPGRIVSAEELDAVTYRASMCCICTYKNVLIMNLWRLNPRMPPTCGCANREPSIDPRATT